MKNLFTRFVLVFVVVFSLLANVGCDKKKALTTVRQADEIAAQLLLYGRNIARANNDSFAARNISSEVHLRTNQGAELYLKGVDIFITAIDAAKAAIKAGANPNGQIDILQAVFNKDVVAAGLALADLIADVPPALKDKIGGWASAIRLAVTTFQILFAEIRKELNPSYA